jgi:hypothetical protein
MTEHTPTPWYVNGRVWIKPKNNGWPIARIQGDQREADAEFIVQACNSHDSLVAALDQARDDILANSLSGALDTIETAIAKAKGQ